MQFIQTNINNVHAALLDSLWGYKECAAVVPDSRLKEKFESIALERERMIRDLEIRGGATKSTSGSVKGSLNRTWTKIKSSLSSGGLQHVLSDLADEEASLKKTYDNALKSAAVDSALNGLLFTHLRNIECQLSEIRIIAGEAKYTHKWDTSVPSTGEIIKDKLHTTGQTISTKFSTSGAVIKDKFSSGGAVIKDKFSTSGAVIKDKLGFGHGQTQTDQPVVNDQHTTGQNIKEKLQATGTAIKDNLQATGTAIKEKLGVGQTQTATQQKDLNTVDNISTSTEIGQIGQI